MLALLKLILIFIVIIFALSAVVGACAFVKDLKTYKSTFDCSLNRKKLIERMIFEEKNESGDI